MKKTLTYLLLGVLVAMLAFVTSYALAQNALLRKMKVKFGRIKIVSFSFDRFVADIYLRFINVSMVDINVTGYDLSVYVNDKFISRTAESESAYIQAQGESIVKITAESSGSELLANVFNRSVLQVLLFDYSKVIIRIRGSISVSHRGFYINNYPVDIQDSLQNILYGKKQTA